MIFVTSAPIDGAWIASLRTGLSLSTASWKTLCAPPPMSRMTATIGSFGSFASRSFHVAYSPPKIFASSSVERPSRSFAISLAGLTEIVSASVPRRYAFSPSMEVFSFSESGREMRPKFAEFSTTALMPSPEPLPATTILMGTAGRDGSTAFHVFFSSTSILATCEITGPSVDEPMSVSVPSNSAAQASVAESASARANNRDANRFMKNTPFKIRQDIRECLWTTSPQATGFDTFVDNRCGLCGYIAGIFRT